MTIVSPSHTPGLQIVCNCIERGIAIFQTVDTGQRNALRALYPFQRVRLRINARNAVDRGRDKEVAIIRRDGYAIGGDELRRQFHNMGHGFAALQRIERAGKSSGARPGGADALWIGLWYTGIDKHRELPPPGGGNASRRAYTR